jgi:hypothetical protein
LTPMEGRLKTTTKPQGIILQRKSVCDWGIL